MSRLVALAGVWPVDGGFVARPWRLVEGGHFSPVGLLAQGAGDASVGAEALLTALDLSEQLSATPWPAAEADADWLKHRSSGPRSQRDEVRLDLDADGRVTAWMIRLDAASRHVCQAVVECSREPGSVAQAIETLLRGGGDPPVSDIDVDLAQRTVMRWLGQDWSDEAAVAALRASAVRLQSTPLAASLTRAADAIQSGPRDAAEPAVAELYEQLATTFLDR